LNTTCESVDLSYACLISNGRMIVATPSWLELKPTEIYLMNLLNLLSGESTYRDIPIYLPNKSPQVFFYDN
jgi:hypothetical protein